MVTRRDFLKLAGVGATAAGTALVGLRLTSSGLFQHSGVSRWVSTFCNQCPAGCALTLLVDGDSLLEVQRNPLHPLAGAVACQRPQDALRLLESPARLTGPLRRSIGRRLGFQPISWRMAADLVAEIFTAYPAHQIAFLLGDYPDHLSDLVHSLSIALGGATVLRITSAGLLDGRITLQDAVRCLFGLPFQPYFDLPHSDLVFAFGVGGAEPWLARFAAAPTRPSGQAWVHFAPLRPPLVAAADEWVGLRPGSEGLLAQAMAAMVAHLKAGSDLERDLPLDLEAVAQAAGIPAEHLRCLARRFAGAASPVALPGAVCLAQSGGLSVAQSVLSLNSAAENLGRSGGLFLTPPSPLYPELSGRTATLAEVQSLLQRMAAGQIKALFAHGVDLFAALPAVLDVEQALGKVERVISFNSLHDQTSPYADALLPDSLPWESWGYQRLSPAADRPLVSAIQPAFAPPHDTRSTADVLLSAVHRAGGALASKLPYRNEQAWIHQAVTSLPWGPQVSNPWQHWLAQGGWWTGQPGLLPPLSLRPLERNFRQARLPLSLDPSGAEFYLQFAPSPDAPAGLSALPSGLCPAAMNPAALERLGLRPGDVVRLSTPAAEIAAQVTVQPGLRPDTLLLTHQGGQIGVNHPWALVKGEQNASGDLAYQSGRVRVS